MESYTLHFDGSCGPKNPGGTAAFGYVLRKTGQPAPVYSCHSVIGTGPGMTNNLAEFCALAFGLEKLTDFMDKDGFTPRLLSVYGDSMLVVNIMNKKWRAKEDKPYSPGYEHAIKVLRKLRKAGVKVTFDWIPREQNQECDDLSNAHEA